MRADRLLSIMMLLQSRGRMSAARLAEALEVSERTIYRDMLALDAAGVPICSQAGPDGGFWLVESYRTSITGLSAGETQALFMLSVPQVFTDLGISDDLKAALRKLAAALPDRLRGDEAHVRERFLLDSTWWQDEMSEFPHLKTVHQAVWTDRMLLLTYTPIGALQIDLTVAPYALVNKAGAWYLVFESAGKMRAIAVSELLDAVILESAFTRRAEFELESFWKSWCERWLAYRRQFHARIRVHSPLMPFLVSVFGPSIRAQLPESGPESGPIELDVCFGSQIEARSRLLGLGNSVEVLSPESLRWTLQDVAQQVVGVYRQE